MNGKVSLTPSSPSEVKSTWSLVPTVNKAATTYFLMILLLIALNQLTTVTHKESGGGFFLDILHLTHMEDRNDVKLPITPPIVVQVHTSLIKVTRVC